MVLFDWNTIPINSLIHCRYVLREMSVGNRIYVYRQFERIKNVSVLSEADVRFCTLHHSSKRMTGNAFRNLFELRVEIESGGFENKLRNGRQCRDGITLQRSN